MAQIYAAAIGAGWRSTCSLERRRRAQALPAVHDANEMHHLERTLKAATSYHLPVPWLLGFVSFSLRFRLGFVYTTLGYSCKVHLSIRTNNRNIRVLNVDDTRPLLPVAQCIEGRWWKRRCRQSRPHPRPWGRVGRLRERVVCVV